jgi:hypothetical protein
LGVPMGAPVATQTVSGPVVQEEVAPRGGPSPATDPLADLGPLLAAVAQRDRDSAEFTADRIDAGQKFLDDFASVCETEVRPAMDAALERLRQLGGGGLLEVHPGGEPRFRSPGLTLWMSLKGEMVGEPRQDRYPYLQLEADPERRKVQVDEGDRWRGAGGNSSGRVATWDVADVTRQRVTEELLAVARRAAH